MTKKELGKRDAHLPAAREFAAGLVEILDREAKAGKDLASVALELIAAKALEAVLNTSVFIEELFGYSALLPASAIASCSSSARSPSSRISRAAFIASSMTGTSDASLVSCSK